ARGRLQAACLRVLLPSGDRVGREVVVRLGPLEVTVAGEVVAHPGLLAEPDRGAGVHLEAERGLRTRRQRAVDAADLVDEGPVRGSVVVGAAGGGDGVAARRAVGGRGQGAAAAQLEGAAGRRLGVRVGHGVGGGGGAAGAGGGARGRDGEGLADGEAHGARRGSVVVGRGGAGRALDEDGGGGDVAGHGGVGCAEGVEGGEPVVGVGLRLALLRGV